MRDNVLFVHRSNRVQNHFVVVLRELDVANTRAPVRVDLDGVPELDGDVKRCKDRESAAERVPSDENRVVGELRNERTDVCLDVELDRFVREEEPTVDTSALCSGVIKVEFEEPRVRNKVSQICAAFKAEDDLLCCCRVADERVRPGVRVLNKAGGDKPRRTRARRTAPRLDVLNRAVCSSRKEHELLGSGEIECVFGR
eukprot:Amastigsp_a676457_481.p2 type:complete len:199 gc:universal Amastigsp_a676457_481:237-833(+)